MKKFILATVLSLSACISSIPHQKVKIKIIQEKEEELVVPQGRPQANATTPSNTSMHNSGPILDVSYKVN